MEHYHDKIAGEMHEPKEYKKMHHNGSGKAREHAGGKGGDVLVDTAKKLISVGIIAGFGARIIKSI